MTRDASPRMVSARPCRDNTPLGNGQGKRAPPIFTPLLVLGNESKEAVRFVGNSGGEINAGAQRKKIPQAIKLQRRTIGLHQRLDESAGRRIVNVNQSVTEVADPKFVVHQSESPRGVKVPV